MFQCTELLGIYLDAGVIDQGLDYCLLRKKSGLWVKEAVPEIDRTGRTLWDQLRQILQSIKPSRTRRICFGLSRTRIFLRELAMPGLSEDDARESVRLGIELHAHIEPESILFDTAVLKKGEGATVLLAYAEKVFLTHIFKIMAETGHSKSLWAISPASLGLDSLLRYVQVKFPCVSYGKQDEKWLLSMHGPSSWAGSHLLALHGSQLKEALKDVTPSSVQENFLELLKTPVLYVQSEPEHDFPEILDSEMRKKLAPLTQKTGLTWALCSAAIGLSPYPLISISEKTRKKPLYMRVSSYQLLLGVTTVSLVMASLLMGWKTYELHKKTGQLKATLQSLQGELSPLLEKQKRIDHLDSIIADTVFLKKEFLPPVEILNILSVHTLPNVTLKSMNIKENTASLTAEADSAVEAMDKWRQMEYTAEVKLTSPVTKDQNQKERFSVDIVFAPVKHQQTGAKQ